MIQIIFLSELAALKKYILSDLNEIMQISPCIYIVTGEISDELDSHTHFFLC